jgi:hypothetical protein
MSDLDTQLLVKIIGMPNISPTCLNDVSEVTLKRLFPLAVKNKVPILFLEKALKLHSESEYLQTTYKTYSKRASVARSLIRRVCEVLNNVHLDFVIFKTVKPFPSFGADVDVILFSREDFMQAFESLIQNGCKLDGYGAFSATLYSAPHVMNVDLHLQISVSRLVYLDTKLMRGHIAGINVDDTQVPVLDGPASIITYSAHSIYKEQILTYADFYTIVFEILQMDERKLEITANLANELHAGLCTKTTLLLADNLIRTILNRSVPEIRRAAELIKVSTIEKKIIEYLTSNLEQNLKLPYGYPPSAVAAAFASKVFSDPILRGSVADQISEVITNLPYLLKNVLLHMKGEAE